MSIKLPATMVFYGESENRPHHLLWWIPSEAYGSVVEGSDALADYPNGLEIEVHEEALTELGISVAGWGLTAAELRSAFQQLHDEGKLPPSGLIQADTLIQLAIRQKQGNKKSIDELYAEHNQPSSFSIPGEAFMEAEDPLPDHPQMTSGEDAEDFFKRLAGF